MVNHDACIKYERIIQFHPDIQCFDRSVGLIRNFVYLGSVTLRTAVPNWECSASTKNMSTQVIFAHGVALNCKVRMSFFTERIEPRAELRTSGGVARHDGEWSVLMHPRKSSFKLFMANFLDRHENLTRMFSKAHRSSKTKICPQHCSQPVAPPTRFPLWASVVEHVEHFRFGLAVRYTEDKLTWNDYNLSVLGVGIKKDKCPHAQPFIVRSYIISLYEAKNTFYITEPRSRKLRVGPAIWTTRCMLAKIVCKAFMLGKRIKKTNYVDFELFIVFSYRISKIQ